MEQIRLLYELDLEPNYVWLSPTVTPTAKKHLPYVQELGLFPGRRKYFTERERLPSYLIKYCVSGKGILAYDGNEYEISGGQIFWLDCMKKQRYQTAPDASGWHIDWVHFYGGGCKDYYDLFLQQNGGSPVVSGDAGKVVLDNIEKLVEIYRNANGTLSDDARAASLLTVIMSRCIILADPSTQQEDLPPYVQDTKRYINQHYAEHISLDVLAHEISINKFYLQKLFSKTVGLSPNEYLTNVRIQEAKRLLRSSNLPIAQIALEVGFGSISHFIEQFKLREQMPPSVYRKRW